MFGTSKESELRQLIETEQVTWPCFYRKRSDPLPALEWGVRDWPANFLIDRCGVVRAVNLFDEQELAATIEDLIAETESETDEVESVINFATGSLD